MAARLPLTARSGHWAKAHGFVAHIQGCPRTDELFIHRDAVGLRRLAAVPERLTADAEPGTFPHEHLFAPEWGGNDLSAVAQEVDGHLTQHVKILACPDARGALLSREQSD